MFASEEGVASVYGESGTVALRRCAPIAGNDVRTAVRFYAQDAGYRVGMIPALAAVVVFDVYVPVGVDVVFAAYEEVRGGGVAVGGVGYGVVFDAKGRGLACAVVGQEAVRADR